MTRKIAAVAGPLCIALTAAADIAPDSLVYHLATNVASHTNGISAPRDSLSEVSGWSYKQFTATNLVWLTNSVWSDNFWLKGVQGLSATSIGLSNNLAAQGMMTMVSPRHYLCATHMHPEGFLAAFLDTNNVIYWRRTIQRVDVGSDTSVGVLNKDLPPSVQYLPVLPANFMEYVPMDGTIVQGIGMNQDLFLFAQPMKFYRQGVLWNSHATAPYGVSTNWNITIRGGDSSNPEMLLISNQLVLVSHNYSVGFGPNYAAQFDAINKSMHYLSTNNALATDYQLTAIALTNWPTIH